MRTLDALWALEREWRGLSAAGRMRNPFLTWEWVSSWMECFSGSNRPNVVMVRGPGGELVGIAPLVRRTRRYRGVPVRELAFVGTGPAAPDHLDVLCMDGAEEDVAGAVLGHLRGGRYGFDLLTLRGAAAGSPLVSRLLAAVPPDHRVTTEEPCPYVRLPSTWDEYLAGRSIEFAKNLRRRRRRLAEDHPSATCRRVDEPQALDAAMDDLVRLHSSRFTGPDGGAFADPGLERFHRMVARRFLAQGWLRLYMLEVDGRPIAVRYGFAHGGVFWAYITGYDQTFARYSPSTQLNAHAIGEAIAEGLHEFDFLQGDEQYKAEWTSDRRHDVNVTVPARAGLRALVSARKRVRR
ncbi:MAG TPA: GNAT family N-acetyltransferase [Acidimicrobiales bacterium]|nr:GNAT family N-acetyltransferase [Acidimicrobiales bacterium]